jgi:hypothetical protein
VLREAEVENFNRTVRPNPDVGRFQIAVHDAFFVCGIESLGNLARDTQCLIERKRAFFDSIRESRPFNQFHHEIVRPDIEESADVWMIQRGNGPSLALEAIGELLRGGF